MSKGENLPKRRLHSTALTFGHKFFLQEAEGLVAYLHRRMQFFIACFYKPEAQAKEEWVIEKLAVEKPLLTIQACIDKQEVKRSIRMELRIREVDKSGAA